MQSLGQPFFSESIYSELNSSKERERMEAVEKGRVCVTGAGGYTASWLVKLLLSTSYKVHGTVRNSGDPKNVHLKNFVEASQNLKLFSADLLDYNSLLAAIAGCEGVFHVASPVPATEVNDPEVEVIKPALEGTLNVLKACSEAKVKKVVVVSSIAAVMLNPRWPLDKVQDEECWSDPEFCVKLKSWYFLSKTMAEGAAWNYANNNGIDLITVCPSVVIGPLLQPTVNTSSMFLMCVIKGCYEQLKDTTWNFVDVRDLADALLLVYQKPEASGRYICAPHSCTVKEMVELVNRMYPKYDCLSKCRILEVGHSNHRLSSQKLKYLGWNFRTLESSVIDSVEYYEKAGLLEEEGPLHLPPLFNVRTMN